MANRALRYQLGDWRLIVLPPLAMSIGCFLSLKILQAFFPVPQQDYMPLHVVLLVTAVTLTGWSIVRCFKALRRSTGTADEVLRAFPWMVGIYLGVAFHSLGQIMIGPISL
jgi:hypothetical protein